YCEPALPRIQSKLKVKSLDGTFRWQPGTDPRWTCGSVGIGHSHTRRSYQGLLRGAPTTLASTARFRVERRGRRWRGGLGRRARGLCASFIAHGDEQGRNVLAVLLGLLMRRA